MVIRDLNIDDIDALARLYYQFWNEYSDVQKMRDMFADLNDNPAYIYLCAEDNGILVGSVMGIVCESIYGGCTPFLVVEDMIVDKKHRKQGVGKMLFQELENRAKAKGCDQVLLVTEANRTDACSFYESLGFPPATNKGYKKKL